MNIIKFTFKLFIIIAFSYLCHLIYALFYIPSYTNNVYSSLTFVALITFISFGIPISIVLYAKAFCYSFFSQCYLFFSGHIIYYPNNSYTNGLCFNKVISLEFGKYKTTIYFNSKPNYHTYLLIEHMNSKTDKLYTKSFKRKQKPFSHLK